MTEKPIATIKAVDASTGEGFFRDISVEFLIHEIKDPISIIETALRLLLEKKTKYGPLTERQEKALKRALRSSKKAGSLLADLLEVGRSDAGCIQCHRFNPISAVEEVLLEVLEAVDAGLWDALHEIDSGPDRSAALGRWGIRITCDDSVCGAVLCQDETKFRQIVNNLIKNAFQHRRQQLDVNIQCREDHLKIEVVDDGPGVEREHRELIFKRYTRLNACAILSRTGHGLGLAGARILARRLGGDITVKDHRGPGAAFCLTLPLVYNSNI